MRKSCCVFRSFTSPECRLRAGRRKSGVLFSLLVFFFRNSFLIYSGSCNRILAAMSGIDPYHPWPTTRRVVEPPRSSQRLMGPSTVKERPARGRAGGVNLSPYHPWPTTRRVVEPPRSSQRLMGPSTVKERPARGRAGGVNLSGGGGVNPTKYGFCPAVRRSPINPKQPAVEPVR